jgi:DNA-directed RNA polymerase-5 subunit 1
MWLQTPRKCFERAAEKRHMDSLSSIVASCSWGRHVAVGTGSRFDILLDTKQVHEIIKFFSDSHHSLS